ncbi:MAG: pyridoxamine 5'-phosphate oxidase family protein [Candidatus Bathyarchaeota archaeon]|nr:pyridoxamine 5'-phosphate oxidase family protein [Candidatus Bathyarchaeota archaeon]
MKPEKLPKMNETEINSLLSQQFLCRIAFCNKNKPYIAVFQYALIDEKMYFHFTNYGRKIKFLKEQPIVCVEIEKISPDLSEYNFVSITGHLNIVTNSAERKKAIEKIVETAKNRGLSEEFMATHGFPKKGNWNNLLTEEELVIVELDEVTEKFGLKSP